MDVEQVIRDNCNPVNINNLVRIVNIFEDIDYDEYLVDVYDKVEEALENDSVNAGRFMSNVIKKHTNALLKDMGITISEDVDDITVEELYQILDFQILIEYLEKEKAQFIMDKIDAIDEIDESYAYIISEYTNITMPRVFEIIEKVDLRYINNLYELMTKIVESDIDDSFNHSLVNIIKDIRVSEHSEIVGLRIIRNNFNSDENFTNYLKIADDLLDNKTMEETAVNFMSLLILGSDSRFNRLHYYVEYCEDLMEDEDFKASVFQRIKMLDEEVSKLYEKYNLKEDNDNGED